MSSMGTMNNNSPNVRTPTKSAECKSYDCGEEIEMKDMKGTSGPESSYLSVHQFARHVRPQLPASDTPYSSSTFSSPGSSNKGDSSMDLSVNENSADTCIDKRVVSRGKEQLASRVHATSIEILQANADDDDLDLSSLRDLMDSMRQAAKEIREITKPMVKGKKKELGLRPRDQKRHHKKKQGHRRNSGHHHQIQAEIHVVSEAAGQGIILASANTSEVSIPERRELEEHHPPVLSSPPTAFLHVENEELSHTWPRRRGRSVSRQRSLTDNVPKPGTSSEGSSPMALPPKHNLWLHPHKAHSVNIKDQRPSAEKLAVHQSSRHHPSQSAVTYSNSETDFQLFLRAQPRSRGRTQKQSTTPRAPPPSPHAQCSPPPHIIVSDHDAFHQIPQQDEGQKREPVDEEIIDMV